MKKILITGANSYIGTSFECYLRENYPNDYVIKTLDMIDGNWKNYDFSNYDTVFHVAGIAHADVGNVSKETEKLYYQVNCDLAYETALKAKEANVKQFIYMSSIIVYGESAPYGKTKVITKDTKPSPANFYGDSKLQAEIKLSPLQDDSFNIAIIRPPMIYGKGSKGNYPMLSKLAKKLDADVYTIEDILEELKHPGQDYRDKLDDIVLKSDVLTIHDLKEGMELKGTVRNVTSFGAFIDIGLHDDGLVHISKMSKNFVKNPNDILSVGDIVTVYVCGIDLEKEKVQLSLIKE